MKCIPNKDFAKASATSSLSATVGSNPLAQGPLGDLFKLSTAKKHPHLVAAILFHTQKK